MGTSLNDFCSVISLWQPWQQKMKHWDVCIIHLCSSEKAFSETKALVPISTLNTTLEASQEGRRLQAAHSCVDISLQTVVWVTSATILLWRTPHHELAVKPAWHHVPAPWVISNTSVLGGSSKCWLLFEALSGWTKWYSTHTAVTHTCVFTERPV